MKFRSGPYYGFREGSLRSHTAHIVSVLKPQSFTEQVSQGSRPSIGINKTSNVLEYFTLPGVRFTFTDFTALAR